MKRLWDHIWLNVWIAPTAYIVDVLFNNIALILNDLSLNKDFEKLKCWMGISY